MHRGPVHLDEKELLVLQSPENCSTGNRCVENACDAAHDAVERAAQETHRIAQTTKMDLEAPRDEKAYSYNHCPRNIALR